LSDLNELLDEDETPPNGYPVVAESVEGRRLHDGIRADRRVLLLSIVAVALFCYTGYVLVSLVTGHPDTSSQTNAGSPTSSPATARSEPTPSAAPPTDEPAATPIPTAEPALPQTPTTPPVSISPVSIPPTTTTVPAPRLCGAPTNPYGYNFCGGSLIYSPARDICSYLTCAANFWKGDGYVVQCQDDTFSKTGGKQKVCSQDQGYRGTLFM
jgi:hypothetical protein